MLPYSFLLGLDFFFQPQHVEYPSNSPIYTTIFGSLEQQGWFNGIMACLLIFFGAVMINRIVLRHRLSRTASLLSGLIYIVLMNMLPGVRGVHDILIANIVITFVIGNAFPLMRLYKTEKLIFNLGFWLATGFVLFPGAISFFPFLFVALFILRKMTLMEILQGLIGFVNVIILVLASCYIFDFNAGYDSLDLIFYWRNLFGLIALHQLPFGLFLGLVYLLCALATLRYFSLLAKQDFKAQKKIRLSYYLLAFSFFSIFFVHHISPHHLLIVCVPLSILLGIALTHWKQKLAAEIIHLLVVIGILYLHFQTVL